MTVHDASVNPQKQLTGGTWREIISTRSQLSETLAFTISTNVGGTAATVVGTNSSDSIAAAQLANISSLQLTAFEADDVVITGTTALTSSGNTLSLGQGDDQVTLSAAITGSGSLVDLGEGADTLSTNFALSNTSIKGFGGLDTMTFAGAVTVRSTFINGNVGGDRITFGGGAATVFASSSIAGGSEDDRITFNTTGAVTGGRVNGQNGDDTIVVASIGAGTTTTMYGGQGNDVLNATMNVGTGTQHVIFSGDLGNDTLTGLNQDVDISGDLLFGGGGNDTINGTNTANTDGGADTMTGGDGADTFVIGTNDMMTATFNEVSGAGTIDIGDTFSLNNTQGAGVFNNNTANITDFTSADILDTTLGTNAVSGLGVAAANAVTNFGTNTNTYKLAGVYNAANSTFTITADNLGTDTLILANGGDANGFLLLKGTSASSLVAANFV